MTARARKIQAPLESEISSAVREYLDMRRDVIVFRANTGAARLPGKGGKMRPVFFGVRGAADFTGLVSPWGVRLEIEIKRPVLGAQSLEQRVFQARIEASGGVYLIVTSVDDCRAKLNAAIETLRKRFGNAP